MPRVESYGQRKVGTARQQGGERRHGAETYASAGGVVADAQADLARAKGGTAGALANLGAQGAQVGLDIIGRERDKADQVAVLSAERRLGELDLELLHSKERGALNVKGKAALELREQVLSEYDKRSAEIAAELSNDRQRLAFEKSRTGRRLAMTEAIERHTVREMTEYDKAETAAAVDGLVQQAVSNAGDPRRVAGSLTEGVEKIRAFAARSGAGPEQTERLIAEFRNDTWKGVIVNRLATGNDRTAKVFFEEARDAGHLSGAVLNELAAAVENGSTEGEAERQAAAIWEKLAPVDDLSPIELDKMEAAARAAAGDNTKVLKATINALRSRKQGVDDARRERADARSSRIWGSIVEGMTEAEVRRLPEFVSAPGEVRNKVVDYFEAERVRAENRAYTLEQREYTREGRAFQREQRELLADQRRDRELELRGWSKYWELSQPENLRGLSHGAIVEQLPVLGTAHVQRLLSEKEQLTKGDAKLREVNLDSDLFREVANEAGLTYVYKPPSQVSDAQKASLGKLRGTMNDELARAQVRAGRALTREETRAVMTSVLDAKVTIDRAFLFDEATPAAIVNDKDRARAYVPIADVPAPAINDYANWLRGEMPGLASTPTDVIKARYGKRLERAYALRLLGANREEITNVLRGQ